MFNVCLKTYSRHSCIYLLVWCIKLGTKMFLDHSFKLKAAIFVVCVQKYFFIAICSSEENCLAINPIACQVSRQSKVDGRYKSLGACTFLPGGLAVINQKGACSQDVHVAVKAAILKIEKNMQTIQKEADDAVKNMTCWQRFTYNFFNSCSACLSEDISEKN